MTINRTVPRIFTLLLVLTLFFGGQSAYAQETPAPESTNSNEGSGGGGGDNLALAVNTKDNSSVVKFAFQVRRVMNGVVDQTNAAVAVASCESCTTIAVAIQIVMVVNDADSVTPTNLALAYNVGCTSCETLASAYQYVFSTDGAVRFTTEGWRALVDIRNQIRDLLKDDTLSIETIQAELDALMAQVEEIVSTQLEPAPGSSTDEGTENHGAPDDGGDIEENATTTPAPEETADEASTPEPEPTEEEASPSPSS